METLIVKGMAKWPPSIGQVRRAAKLALSLPCSVHHDLSTIDWTNGSMTIWSTEINVGQPSIPLMALF